MKHYRKTLLTGYLILCLALLAGLYESQLRYAMALQLEHNMSTEKIYLNQKAKRLLSQITYGSDVLRTMDLKNEEQLSRYLINNQSSSYASGGTYLFRRNSRNIIATSDLPTGYPKTWNRGFSMKTGYTIPYVRSSDELPVITLCEDLKNGWMLSADVPLTEFSAYFAPEADAESFCYLLDGETGQILSAPSDDSLGLTLAETEDSIFPANPFAASVSSLKTVKDASGQKHYWHSAEIVHTRDITKEWIMIYYQTPGSLRQDTLAGNFQPWPTMTGAAVLLVLVGLAVFLPKRKPTTQN